MDRPLAELKPHTRWLGRRVEVHDEVDSTNTIAEQRGGEGAPDGLVVLADRQTAGRGRLGRSFFSPGGRSLYLSVLLRSEIAPDPAGANPAPQQVSRKASSAGFHASRLPVKIGWPSAL